MLQGIRIHRFRIAVVMFIIMLLMMNFVVLGEEDINGQGIYYNYALKLSEMDILQGNNGDLALEREMTRIEAIIILVRLLGGETEAIELSGETCPFTDVPTWGNGYVIYAYNRNLTKGVGNGLFGSNDIISADSFMTLMLRSLGYNEEVGDFAWNEASQYATEIGVIEMSMHQTLMNQSLTRDYVSKIIFDTLMSYHRGSGMTLGSMLVYEGAIDYDMAVTHGLISVEVEEETEFFVEAEQEVEETEAEVGEVNDEIKNYEISLLGATDISQDTLGRWARSKGMNEEGIELISIYYEICNEKGLNPVLQYLQMCHETGWLYKNGSAAGLDASYHNPCGLKTTSGGGDYDSDAHARFNSWYEGIDAHTDHTALYCGLPGYPRAETSDPRHFAWLFGRSDTLEGLSGLWAPSENYHVNILDLYTDLLAYE